MTKDEIIKLAREAGLYSGNPRTPGTENMIARRLERFAALIEQAVRQDERQQCARACDALARKSHAEHHLFADMAERGVRLAKAVGLSEGAAAIRARGNA